jgi:hypothetical protein
VFVYKLWQNILFTIIDPIPHETTTRREPSHMLLYHDRCLCIFFREGREKEFEYLNSIEPIQSILIILMEENIQEVFFLICSCIKKNIYGC